MRSSYALLLALFGPVTCLAQSASGGMDCVARSAASVVLPSLIRIDNAKDFIARGAPDETEGGFCAVGIELSRRENERGIGH